MKIRRGDTVIVVAGKDKGARGKVLSALPGHTTQDYFHPHGSLGGAILCPYRTLYRELGRYICQL